MEARLGDALGRARRRLRDGRQGPDRFGEAVRRDLPRARRAAAGRLQLRAFPRREGPEDLEVERQRADDRGMAALRLAGIAVALHVSRAEGGQAALLRRHPAHGRRVPAVPRRLFAPGPAAAIVQSGLAHPFRQSAERGDADLVLDAADAGVVIECRECRDAVGLHRPLPAGRHAADPSEAQCDQVEYALHYFRDFVLPAKKFREPTRCRARGADRLA